MARIGYINTRENANGREVAAIAVDEERSPLIQLAFDLAATGDHTITTVTAVLENAGLRTRGSYKRPSKPMTRSMVHRLLRDDYYTGIVTHKGVKGQGRHEALIDRATFDQVQKVLDSSPHQRRPFPQTPPFPEGHHLLHLRQAPRLRTTPRQTRRTVRILLLPQPRTARQTMRSPLLPGGAHRTRDRAPLQARDVQTR